MKKLITKTFLVLVCLKPALALAQEAPEPAKLWRWSLTSGLNNYDYNEQVDDLKVSSQTLTVGMEGHRWITEDKLDLRISAQISAVNLGSSVSSQRTSEISAPAYYKADVGLGYLIPQELTGLEGYKVRTGAAFQTWGMMVPESSYGIKFVMGPQIMAEIENLKNSEHPWTAYLKVAPLSEKTITLQMVSYKFNLGGAYRLNTFAATHPLDVTLDLEKILLKLDSSVNEIQVTNFGLGIRYGF